MAEEEKKSTSNEVKQPKSKSEERRQQVVNQKRTYFVPGLRRAVKAKNGKDLEQVVKSNKGGSK